MFIHLFVTQDRHATQSIAKAIGKKESQTLIMFFNTNL